MSERILVTGAAGFIGFHLCRSLLETGGTVVGFDNLNDYYDVHLKQSRLAVLRSYDRFTFVRGDLADAEAVNGLFAVDQPDAVVHLGAQAGVRYSMENPRAYMDSNMTGFFNVLEAVRAHPVRHLLFASSSSVYGNQQKTPFSVDDPVDRPVSLYAATKKSNELMAYTYAHLYGVPTTGLRFFTVYGPFGRPDMAYFKFTKKILAGDPIDIYNHGDLKRDFTFVDDIVSCLSRMICIPPKADAGGERYALYNIGNNHPVDLMQFLKVLETAVGRPAHIHYLPMQPGDVYQTYADIQKTTEDFGFVPETPIEVGLPLFVDWYKNYYGAK
ncbi:MAG: SDR family NAD(P)-dependent oxidoreductase [Clostridia bacterium]